MTTRWWRPVGPVDVVGTLSVHRRGPYDPTFAVGGDGAVWRTCRLDGAALTVRVRPDAARGEIELTAWGAPAADVLDVVPSWLGADDDASGFRPEHPVLAESYRRRPGLRIGRTGAVIDALVPAVLEQKVTSIEAYRGWRALVRAHGEPAPGPADPGLFVAPSAEQWARIASWNWHRAGVGPQRSRTIVTATRAADRLAEAAHLPSAEADRRLQAVPGIGPWTSAEVRQRSHGDPDAVSVGDAGLPHLVAYALAGERRASDERMLELLEPYRGHRYRACLFLSAAPGARPPRRAPRAPIRDYRRF